jgi:hypothetical protein
VDVDGVLARSAAALQRAHSVLIDYECIVNEVTRKSCQQIDSAKQSLRAADLVVATVKRRALIG